MVAARRPGRRDDRRGRPAHHIRRAPHLNHQRRLKVRLPARQRDILIHQAQCQTRAGTPVPDGPGRLLRRAETGPSPSLTHIRLPTLTLTDAQCRQRPTPRPYSTGPPRAASSSAACPGAAASPAPSRSACATTVLRREPRHRAPRAGARSCTPPQYADLQHIYTRIAPAYVQLCGLDPLRDEARLYVRLLRDAGVAARVDMCIPGRPASVFPSIKAAERWEADFRAGLAWLLAEGGSAIRV
ncbi:hypothetical protein B0H10DRAFT_1826656 [Mycena sp. CBHHK59/15]|nr:hypothetical protein B0H10DRAFT_1826656 [Mycena sp. CBHHK59/15]